MGLYTAGLLAEKGVSVLVLEEHAEIGKPIQCAGIITPRVFDFTGQEPWGLPVRGAIFHPPKGAPLSFKAQQTKALVVDRARFDKDIARFALARGANLALKHSFHGFSRSGDGTLELQVHDSHRNGITKLKTKLLVGADGVASRVRQAANLPGPDRMVSGFQVDLGGSLPGDLDPESVELFLGSRYAPGFFAWLVPIPGGVRVGLCSASFGKALGGLGKPSLLKKKSRAAQVAAAPFAVEPALSRFRRLMGERLASRLEGLRPLAYFAGAIPFGPGSVFTADNIALVGDAAAQVKASSGGGIYTGFCSARELVPVLCRSLETKDYSQALLSDYRKRWSRGVGRDIRDAYRLHRAFTRFTDKQLDEFIRMVGHPEIIRLIEEKGDIDYPSRLALSIFRKRPQLIKFSPKLLSSFI